MCILLLTRSIYLIEKFVEYLKRFNEIILSMYVLLPPLTYFHCGLFLNLNKPDWCLFFLIPMMHSEDIKTQEKSLPLFKKYTSQHVYQFAIKHKEIISFFSQVKDQINALRDNLDITDVHNLLAIKSFFGPISLYASPQRQQINEQMVGKRKIP